MSIENKVKVFFPNLDGLRFLCFLSVFFFHSFYTQNKDILDSNLYSFIKSSVFSNGNIGVNFFFVLSGFLITFLLIKEKELNHKINVINFWIRRILRIWPLYFFCIFFGFTIFPYLKTLFGQTSVESASLVNFLTFTSNFDLIRNGLPDSSVLGVLWSIAIEEQFYFAWPLLLAIIPFRHYQKLFLLIIAGTVIFRALYDDYLYLEYHTLSCIGDMAVGALGAYLMQSEKLRLKVAKLKRPFILLIYMGFFFIFFFRHQAFLSLYGIRIFERLILAVFIIFIILEQNYAERSFFKMSRFKWISKLGLITYGLYCLHFIGILIIINAMKYLHVPENPFTIYIVQTIFALALTILIAWLSYRFFERPFLKLKNRFAYFRK